MAKKNRPSGGRPPGRRGRGGIGPPSPSHGTSGRGRGGTKHGGSSGTRAMLWLAIAIFLPLPLALLAAIGYLIQAAAS